MSCWLILLLKSTLPDLWTLVPWASSQGTYVSLLSTIYKWLLFDPMYLFGLSAVLLPLIVFQIILKVWSVVLAVGLMFALLAFLVLKVLGRHWSATDKKSVKVALTLPFSFLMVVGLWHAPGAGYCEAVRGVGHMYGSDCEYLETAWFRWMYLPSFSRNSMAGTPEQEELISQSLPKSPALN